LAHRVEGEGRKVSAVLERLASALADRYRIERELGGGGMSRVFLATEIALGRAVVIKVITPELADGLSPERFTREVKLAARLQQANIVPLLHAGDAEGMAYYTMPYVDGASLRARLATGEPLGLSDAMHILRDIAKALSYAHAQGVVHRDIKPENVLLSGGTAMVIDFGIAKALTASRHQDADAAAPMRSETLTSVGMSLGTPAYMSPEQAVGSAVDLRADLYAWGVIAYELLSGAHPFADRTSATQMVAAHIAETPTPITTRNATITAATADIVMRCLAKDPAHRPASASELLAALDRSDTPIPSAPPAMLAPDSAGRERVSPRRTIAVAGAFVTIAAAGAWYQYGRGQDVTTQLEPKRVVVATFVNKSGDATLDPLGVMAADWIARGLVGTGLVDVGGTSADLAARGAASRAIPGESPIQLLARDANAGIVISGAYYRQGDSVLFQADFTDANARTLVQTVGPVSALASAPLTGVELLRQRVIGGLAPLVDSALATQAIVMSRPPSLEAYRELLAGESLFYRDDSAAVIRYARAAAADTTYIQPLLRAMLAFQNRGDQSRYDSVARIVHSRRERLTPYEQAYLDYVTCGDRGDRSTCVESTRRMMERTPKSQFTAYLHAIMLRWDNRPAAAESIFSALDPRSGELRGRIYLPSHHARALHSLGKHERELAIARDGSAQYANRLFLAPDEISALIALGRLDEANRKIEAMFGLAPDLRSSAMRFAANAIYEFRWHGHAAAGDALGERLLARIARHSTSALSSTAAMLDNAEALAAMHRWAELERIADAALAADEYSVRGLTLRGIALAMQGKRSQALDVERTLARAVTPLRPVDGCTGAWRCREDARAYILAALGDKAGAVSLMDFRYFNEQFAHYDLLGEMLRGFPPFEAFIKPRG
jgi:tRNA A-37 threonylcarbamoyl transferase component Bud32